MTKKIRHYRSVSLERQLIGLKGVINARELGGYENKHDRVIKRCKLIRTGQLYSADTKDKKILNEDYNVGTIIDFRSEFETASQPDPPIFGARYYNLPVLALRFTESDLQKIQRSSEENENGIRLMLLAEAGMTADTAVYDRIMFGEPAKKAYKRFFELLLENDDEHSVLFHCTQGKDRTGIAAALLLTLLDVPDEIIMSDYLLTNSANARIIQSDIDAVMLHNADNGIIDSVRRMNGVSEYLIEYVLSKARVEYGSVRDFIKKTYELSEADIAELNQKYLI